MKIRKYKIIVLFTMLLLTSTFIVGIYLLAGEVKNGLDKEEIENNSITYENLEEIINSYSLEGLKKELVEVEAAKGREIDISGMSIVLPDGWSEKQSKRFE
ncbi:MAG: hypothetical protein KatS3mg085_039 [Candidatus Dojkabacteria bacterium]|nr:MAG: hypothetical protein KatS3mg085_039 [Candidatus Dojkabacteria bacterium]